MRLVSYYLSGRPCYLCAQLGHAGQLVTIGAFTLAGISGIQILVFASRSKSWDFYKRGHKNPTNYRDQHRAANRNKSCDYLGISAIICIAADVWTLEQIHVILVFLPGKGKGYIPAWYQAYTVWLTELSRSAISEIFPPVWTSAKYLSISIAMEILIFLVCECA